MKTIIALVAIAVAAACSRPAPSQDSPVVAAPIEPGVVAAPESPPQPIEPEDRVQLERYLATLMQTWRKPQPSAAEQTLQLAHDITLAVYDVPPLFQNEPPPHARSAVLLASVAFYESGWADYVLDYECNDMQWAAIRSNRERMAGATCDGGLAWGPFQVHADEAGGIVLTDDGYYVRPWDMPPERRDTLDAERIISGRDLAADHSLAPRVALAMIRYSLDRCAGTLNCYAGRGNEGKAAARLQFARDWSARRPFTVR